MNKKELKAKRHYLINENRKYQSCVFVEIPRQQWPARPQTIPLDRVFRSREFLVQIFTGEPTRLSINRTELDGQGNWRDGITWDEMQQIKNGVGFAEQDAVEAFPAKSDMVYVANVRHLWIVPPEYAQFFWRRGQSSGYKSGQTAEELTGLYAH